MNYIIGFDGGGSKTRGVLANLKGDIIADHTGKSSNYHIIGKKKTKEHIEHIFNTLLREKNIAKKEIKFVFLGLAGADLPVDFAILNTIAKTIFKNIPFKIVNDAWIIMRSGIQQNFGAVSICGTGANAAAVNSNGKKKILRALGYPYGSYDGGSQIANEALQAAFRSNELTGDFTILEKEIPKLFNKKSMEELLPLLHPENKIRHQIYKKIPPLVFECAKEQDSIAINILKTGGKIQGKMVKGALKGAEMPIQQFPLVIGGSIFKGITPHFIDSMIKEIKCDYPEIYVIKPSYPPVYGALFYAYDELNIEIPFTL